MERIKKKHPLAIRWFHWVNFPVLTVMIWSGLQIYWANGIYNISIGGSNLIHFFPDSFYDALHLPYHLSEGMAWHFVFMWIFFGNGFFYIAYTLFSGEWRFLIPNKNSFKEAWQVLLHDLHIREKIPPQDKYNSAQKIVYTAIIIMGFGSLLTGLAIYKPIQLGWLCGLFGGYESCRIIHFILMIGYCLFFIIHVAQVILAGWQNFSSMITGFEVLKNKKKQNEKK